MVKNWWKICAAILLIYTLIAGMLTAVPALPILHETIRNLYFHVPMWFTMIFLLAVSVVNGIIHLRHGDIKSDIRSAAAIKTAMFFGVLGLLTGMLWARFTWGTFWTKDPHLNGSAITMLAYLAYFVLRNSIEDEQLRGRVAAVYGIFAFVIMLVFIGILPRMTDSLHPGKGGNPGFNTYDLNNNMKLVFYPAVIGWIMLGFWFYRLQEKLVQLHRKLANEYER
jgi:heme exporter protein C